MGILELILLVLNIKGLYDFWKKYSVLSKKEKDFWLPIFDGVSYQPWLYIAAAADLIFPSAVVSNTILQVLAGLTAGVIGAGGLAGIMLKREGKVYY